MKRLILIVMALGLTGCAYFQKRGAIKVGDASVTGVADAGKPATLNTSQAGSVLPLPEGTTFTLTKFEAIPATLGPNGHPAVPARTVTEIVLTKPTELRTTESRVQADTGTIDTTVAMKKINAAESRPLLYLAIVSVIAVGFFMYKDYKTPAGMSAFSAVAFFLAWKASGLPDWFWMLGVAGLVGGFFLYIGHERGLTTSTNPTATK